MDEWDDSRFNQSIDPRRLPSAIDTPLQRFGALSHVAWAAKRQRIFERRAPRGCSAFTRRI
jgi:hypothetical protein